MPIHGTILCSYLYTGDILLGADGMSVTPDGKSFARNAIKVEKAGQLGAFAIGGDCEVIVKEEGDRKGRHWKLLESLNNLPDYPASSPEARARYLFDAGQAAAEDWLRYDTDEETPRIKPNGIVILYAEVSDDGTVDFWRAEIPIIVTLVDGRHTRTVAKANVNAIVSSKITEPFLYLHNSNQLMPAKFPPPADDQSAAAVVAEVIRQRLVGDAGDIRVIRMDVKGIRKISIASG